LDVLLLAGFDGAPEMTISNWSELCIAEGAELEDITEKVVIGVEKEKRGADAVGEVLEATHRPSERA
jgi:hypothetical protein